MDNMLWCLHKGPDGTCELSPEREYCEYCVEGPCPHERLVSYVAIVHCNECKYWKVDYEHDVTECACIGGLASPEPYDFCSLGEREDERA